MSAYCGPGVAPHARDRKKMQVHTFVTYLSHADEGLCQSLTLQEPHYCLVPVWEGAETWKENLCPFGPKISGKVKLENTDFLM